MRAVLPTHRGGHNLHGSKPPAREGFTVSNLIYIKKMFHEIEERGRKRLTDASAALVDKVSPAVPSNAEEGSSVAETSAAAKNVEKMLDVVPGE